MNNFWSAALVTLLLVGGGLFYVDAQKGGNHVPTPASVTADAPQSSVPDAASKGSVAPESASVLNPASPTPDVAAETPAKSALRIRLSKPSHTPDCIVVKRCQIFTLAAYQGLCHRECHDCVVRDKRPS